MLRMRRLEDDVREQLEQVDSRLNSLSSQIEALSARLNARERKAQTDEPAGSSNGKRRQDKPQRQDLVAGKIDSIG